MKTTIYVYLKNEGTDCWRPVEAEKSGDEYKIITSRDKEDEEWQFDTGTVVKCVQKEFQDGEKGLVAVAKANDD
jgi:hypothetical protein